MRLGQHQMRPSDGVSMQCCLTKASRFYPLLEPVWWRMRDLVFEPKPPPKTRLGRKKSGPKDGGAQDAYEVSAAASRFISTRLTSPHVQADNDTEHETRTPVDRAREETRRRINKLIASAPEPSHHRMSAHETDTAVIDLVVRLADIRALSDPDAFQRVWDQHIGRLNELENGHDGGDQAEVPERTPGAASLGNNHNGHEEVERRTPSTSAPAYRNLSNEPFAMAGNPLPQSFPRPIPARVPAAMATYVTTAPPESPYTQQAYEWLDAPVRMVDQKAFYDGLMLRVKMPAERVQGLVMSYGWCDVCRWIAAGSAGERKGWSVLQTDLAWAAGRGVMVWRMKVLVVGS